MDDNARQFSFTAYVHPEPQGSAKAFIIKGRAHVTSANSKLKPFRSEVTRCAMVAISETKDELPFAGKHVPVLITLKCFLEKTDGVPKKRTYPSVKPDLDKLVRSCLDSLTGVAFKDDGQVISVTASKHYGSPERVEITVTAMGPSPAPDKAKHSSTQDSLYFSETSSELGDF
jgi:crossover junction endodeoxyribonuclease RusA